MSSTGTTTRRSKVLAAGGETISTGARPPRNRATSSAGRTVAESPMRCTGLSSMASSRSSETARCAPRFVEATAWISSMMTVSTVRRVSRAALVSMRNNDSGVVMRMSGGSLAMARRSADGVSPERTPTLIVGGSVPRRRAAWAMPTSGVRRLRSTSTPSAFSGEMYSTRVPRERSRWASAASASSASRPLSGTPVRRFAPCSAIASDSRRSIDHRKADRVLPDPVGATTRALAPREIASQAPA